MQNTDSIITTETPNSTLSTRHSYNKRTGKLTIEFRKGEREKSTDTISTKRISNSVNRESIYEKGTDTISTKRISTSVNRESIYEFYHVDQESFLEFLMDKSTGQAFHEVIRNKFNYSKLK